MAEELLGEYKNLIIGLKAKLQAAEKTKNKQEAGYLKRRLENLKSLRRQTALANNLEIGDHVLKRINPVVSIEGEPVTGTVACIKFIRHKLPELPLLQKCLAI